MITHYNAFISYKHEPDDIEVAREIQRGLEYFRIPGKLRKEYGEKRINKVFRDKDELALTNDLTDTIYNALDHSDHLIVVCSTQTKKSQWVQKEIEYFLKSHDKKDVFTVLVNGEPDDVIPEVLLHETVEEKDESGNVHLAEKTRELVSCDYRIPLKKAKKEELPRLVSAMIGCSYSELINRRRIHAIKQLSVIMAVLLFISAMFTISLLRSSSLIKQSYLTSLKDQSVQLSGAASELLKAGERVDALMLMLSAVPGENNPDMPITSSAVKTLIGTTYAYKTPDHDAYDVVWNYRMSSPALATELSEDGSIFAASDNHGELKVWDTSTHKVLLEKQNKNAISAIRFLDSNTLLTMNPNKVIVYDIGTGKELYTIQMEGSIILDSKLNAANDASYYLCSAEGTLSEYSASDGSLIRSFELTDTASNSISFVLNGTQVTYSYSAMTSLAVSEKGTRVAYAMDTDAMGTDVFVFDIETKKITPVYSSDREVGNLIWSGEDTLIFSESESYENKNMIYDKEYLIGKNHSELHCYDYAKNRETWHASHTYNYPVLSEGFLFPSGTDTVAYYAGNTLAVYDLATGKDRFSCDLGDTIVSVNDKGDGKLHCFTENGGFAAVDTADKEAKVAIRFLFPESIQTAVSTENGIYMMQTEKENIMYYEKGAYDDALAFFGQGPTVTSVGSKYMSDEALAVICDDGEGSKLCVYDLTDYESCSIMELPIELSREKATIIGIYNGIVYVLGSDSDIVDMGDVIYTAQTAETVYEIDYKNKTVKPADLPKLTGNSGGLNASVLCQNELVYPVSNETEETASVMILNLDTWEAREVSCPADIINSIGVIRYDRDSGMIVCSGEADCIIDLESGQTATVKYPDDWKYTILVSEITDGIVYISNLETIFAVDKSGTTVREYTQEGYYLHNMLRIDTGAETSELLVMYDGFAVRYDAQTGEELGEFDTDCKVPAPSKVYHDTKNSLLYISRYPYSMVIDTKDWKEITCVKNTFGYDENKNRFPVLVDEDGMVSRIGYFERYTAEDLIEKAKGITGDEELSVELKADYSVGD